MFLWQHKLRVALAIYAALLLASFVVRHTQPEQAVPADLATQTLAAVRGANLIDAPPVRLAYQDLPGTRPDAPVVVLLHGSPGSHGVFRGLTRELAGQYRFIVPDLPGFGASEHSLPDYSFQAHAVYVLQLLDKLGIKEAHFVAFSMGGGVVAHVYQQAPQRVQSAAMVSALGVQEMELLGDYHLNHALHGAQLAFFWGLRELVPHFGYFPDAVPFARNFYDSDQRPLRDILLNFQPPMLIVHGPLDPLVPVQAARETARIVPQSELHLLEGENHFTIFMQPAKIAPLLHDFWQRVQEGQMPRRNQAEPQRVNAALAAFDPHTAPQAVGVTAFAFVLLLALATLISEDLTCLSAGALAANGRMSFALAAFACWLGIYVGDVLLYAAGRWLGRPALARAPLKWFVSEKAVARSSEWFERQGLKVIFLSRFVPGTRLPTYVAAGLLRTKFWRFALYFLIAAAVWTPALVWLGMRLSAATAQSGMLAGRGLLVQIAVGAVVALIVVRLAVRLATRRGRQQLAASGRRWRHWEFWPPYVFYPPVVLYVLGLGVKYRSLTLFTCANPAMPASGFIGESKFDILHGLTRTGRTSEFVARAALLPASLTAEEKLAAVHKFQSDNDVRYPLALKPDAGQRGAGVALVKNEAEAAAYCQTATGATIVQEYAAGDEFGVFYYRYPDETHGRIFALTEKKFPVLTGDGRRTVEDLIWADRRAACLAQVYCEAQTTRLKDVPADGETLQLVELGTHCRGAVFLDGGALLTPALEAAIDAVSREYAGFYFGRYDIRTPSLTDFQSGKNFKVIELNGVTSEATSIYDPRHSVLYAYRVLCEQWRIAFAIGAQNRARGVQPVSLWQLAREIRKFSQNS